MSEKLEIILKEFNSENVNLDSFSPVAMDSFMKVVASLKSIATLVGDDDSLRFSIKKGSAICAVEAPPEIIENIYNEIDTAIKGESDDKEITSYLRTIQEQVKRNNFDYRFIYNPKNKTRLSIHERLKESKKISIKRRRNDSVYKLKVIKGFLNQIGGKSPNYHFDYGFGNKITIDCTQEEAMEINKFLYTDVEALLLCKESNQIDKKDEYYHKQILSGEISSHLKKYIKTYYRKPTLLDKLTYTHDFIDSAFENTALGHSVLETLLLAFNSRHFHLSEIKTLLVISKPFKNHELIEANRRALLETYNKKKTNG